MGHKLIFICKIANSQTGLVHGEFQRDCAGPRQQDPAPLAPNIEAACVPILWIRVLAGLERPVARDSSLEIAPELPEPIVPCTLLLRRLPRQAAASALYSLQPVSSAASGCRPRIAINQYYYKWIGFVGRVRTGGVECCLSLYDANSASIFLVRVSAAVLSSVRRLS